MLLTTTRSRGKYRWTRKQLGPIRIASPNYANPSSTPYLVVEEMTLNETVNHRQLLSKRLNKPYQPQKNSRSESPGSESFLTSDDKFSTIHTRSNSSNSNIQYLIFSENDPITNTIQFISDEAKTKTSPNTLRTPTKIPPIIINMNSWPSASQLIIPMFSDKKLTAKLVKNTIHLQTTDADTFRKASSNLSDKNIPFHRFSLPEERTLKVLHRGILPSFS